MSKHFLTFLIAHFSAIIPERLTGFSITGEKTDMFDKLIRLAHSGRERREQAALMALKARYHTFRIFLDNNGTALELIVDLDSRLINRRQTELDQLVEQLMGICCELVDGLNLLSYDRYSGLYAVEGKLAARVMAQLEKLGKQPGDAAKYTAALDDTAACNAERFGNKAAMLAKLKRLGMPVPDGFMCSTMACREFLEEGGIANEIRELLKKVESGMLELSATTRKIQSMILDTAVPASVAAAFREEYDRLIDRTVREGKVFGLSVRSSGVSEDSRDFSFAGQYSSILNVQGFPSLLNAYREVIASGFSSRAISYRRNASLPVVDLDLAVVCQLMLDPFCAGVMFTHDPAQPNNGRMVISAVPGLGKSAVDGSAPADVYRPYRIAQTSETGFGPNNPGSIQDASPDLLMKDAVIAHKTSGEVPGNNGGLITVSLSAEQTDAPLLSPSVLKELVNLGGIIESMEKTAQDIEWAWSADTGVAILQSRPLRLTIPKEGHHLKLPSIATPLISGTCASSGKVVGQVITAHSTKELHQLQTLLTEGKKSIPLILVLPQSIVDAAPLIKYCGGMVIDIGNPTDHLSCIAREYGIPMITGADTALGCLKDDDWVMVDADRGLIFRAPESVRPKEDETGLKGQSEQQQEAEQPETDKAKDAADVAVSEWEKLRKMIVPLNLTDQFGPTFSFMECRSVHDIIRYCHEMAVLSMFDAGDRVMKDAGNLLHPLELDIPFSFLVIDVGGGIKKQRNRTLLERMSPRNPVFKDDICSRPLAALCEGLMNPDISWHGSPDPGSVGGIFSRTMRDRSAPSIMLWPPGTIST